MRTALTLSTDQVARMLAYAKDRMAGIEAQRAQGWLAARERFDREFDDDFTHREWNSAVFAKSNESLSLIAGGIDFVRARLIEEIFGVSPWLGISPRTRVGEAPVLAEELSRHLTWKLGPEQMDYEAHATEMITTACKLGESVAKVVYVSDVDRFERIASILFDSEAGLPVTDANGEFVFRDEGAVDSLPEGYASEGDGAGRFCWREQIVSDQRVRYVGAKAIPLHYKEFYIPLNAKSVQEADFVAHKTSMRLSSVLKQMGLTRDSDHDARVQTIIDRIKEESAQSKAAVDQPNREQGEGALPAPYDGDPEFAYVEAYFTFDVFGDGRAVRVFFTFAYDSDTPIFWDYISNVTPDGDFPFVAVVMNKVAHRWYGTSWFKKYERQSNLIDKLLNQVIYRNHIAANPIKFRRKEAVVQWQDDQPFEVGPDTVLDLNDGYSAKDALDFADVPQLDAQTQFLLDMSVSAWRTRSGVSTVSQGMFGGLPAENTATGTQRLVATGNTQFRPILLDVKRGLESELRMLARLQYFYQEDEVYTYQQNDAQLAQLLSRDAVRDLDLVLELKLTNLNATETLRKSQLAADLGEKFLAVPDVYKPVFSSIYEQIFQSLQIDDADRFFAAVINIADKRAYGSDTSGSTDDENGTGAGDYGDAAVAEDGVARGSGAPGDEGAGAAESPHGTVL